MFSYETFLEEIGLKPEPTDEPGEGGQPGGQEQPPAPAMDLDYGDL